jgi:tetratricopeptide (TPR) repeat protein
MHKWTEAQQCFKTVLKEYKYLILIKNKTYKRKAELFETHYIFYRKDRFETLLSIPPQSLMELGLIEMSLNNYEESKVILNKVLETYSDYMSEHLVHIHCYSALREMGVNTDNENECEVNISKNWFN